MQHRSRDEWKEILKEFKSLKISRKEFCELKNIKKVTLNYRLSKERKKTKVILYSNFPSKNQSSFGRGHKVVSEVMSI